MKIFLDYLNSTFDWFGCIGVKDDALVQFKYIGIENTLDPFSCTSVEGPTLSRTITLTLKIALWIDLIMLV